MKTRDWKDAAELVGISAIVASLIFVGLQMKQAQEIANADRRMMLVANTIELHNAINENSDIWARGLSGEELSAAQTVIFENLLKNRSAFVFFNWRAGQNVGSGTGPTELIAHFSAFLHENPGARHAWEAGQKRAKTNVRVLMPGVEPAEDYEQIIFGHLNVLDQLQKQ